MYSYSIGSDPHPALAEARFAILVPMEGLTFRLGTADDAAVLARHRCEMFLEMGTLSVEHYPELAQSSTAYFQDAIPNDHYRAWLVESGESIIAGAGMQINTLPPRPRPNGSPLGLGPQGLILNVFVEKDWRGRGIARELMRRIIDYARDEGLPSLALHASDAGRPLYEQLGFQPTTEMRLFL